MQMEKRIANSTSSMVTCGRQLFHGDKLNAVPTVSQEGMMRYLAFGSQAIHVRLKLLEPLLLACAASFLLQTIPQPSHLNLACHGGHASFPLSTFSETLHVTFVIYTGRLTANKARKTEV